MNCTTPPPPPLLGKALRRCCLLCLVAAVATAAFVFPGRSQAQEGTDYKYVDLIITYEYDNDRVAYTVRNIGTATATGVTVSFLLEDLQAGTFSFLRTPSSVVPSIIDKRTVDNTNQRFSWDPGTILPGESSRALAFSAANHSGHSTANRIGSTTATASSNQDEPGLLSANNVTKVYSFPIATTGSVKHMRDGFLSLLLSVDDLRPDAGGDVDFGLTAQRSGSSTSGNNIDLIGDIEIRVELSDGLKFKDSWTPTAADKFTIDTGRKSATWKPEAVDGSTSTTRPKSREIEIETQLTSDSLERIPLEERCITAWVEDSKPPPSPDYVLGSLKQCLGDDPTLLFEGGKLGLFTLFPCVGVTPIAYPCRDDDGDSTVDNGLEIVAGSDITSQSATRTQGVGRSDSGNNIYLRPGTVVVQVDDRGGREVDSSNNLAWWMHDDQGVSPTLDNSLLTAAWTHFVWQIASVKSPTGGHVYYGPNANRAAVYVNTNDKTQHPPAGLTAMPAALKAAIPTYYKFTALGTYVIDFTQKNTHSTAGTVSATGRYTFHVGPIAELEVRDGGASPYAPADRNALTVVAVNNGPDRSLGARVTKLPKGAEVLRISQGSYDGTKGEWDTGELEDSHLLEARGFPGHATLVLNADPPETPTK